MRPDARVYLGTVMGGGVVASVAGVSPLTHQPALDWSHAALLLALTSLAALLVILRLVSPGRHATSGVTSLVLFGALLLTSPQTVILVAAVLTSDALCLATHDPPPWFVVGFNGAQLMLAAVSAHAVNAGVQAATGSSTGAVAVLAAVPAVVVFFSVSYGLVWGVHRLAEDAGGFVRRLAAQGVEEFSLLMIAALARAAWAVEPWLALLACGPLLLFWRLYRTVGRLEEANVELLRSQERALDGLVRALAARDNEVAGHCDRVAHSCAVIGRAMGFDPESDAYEYLVRGALLHDVGKIAVRDAVLHKPGALTPEEWREMRDHASQGYALVRNYPFLNGAAGIVLTHHERWDGRGYPLGLSGKGIPLASRIFAVADTYDAITTTRPYRAAQSPREAVREIQRCSDAQFDPVVVECFLTLYEQLPIAPRPSNPAPRRVLAVR